VQPEVRIPIPFGALERAVDPLRAPIRAALSNARDQPKSRGQDLAAHREGQVDLLDWVSHNWEERTPVMPTEKLHYGEAKLSPECRRSLDDVGSSFGSVYFTISRLRQQRKRTIAKVKCERQSYQKAFSCTSHHVSREPVKNFFQA
jgi:hypothetical protein